KGRSNEFRSSGHQTRYNKTGKGRSTKRGSRKPCILGTGYGNARWRFRKGQRGLRQQLVSDSWETDNCCKRQRLRRWSTDERRPTFEGRGSKVKINRLRWAQHYSFSNCLVCVLSSSESLLSLSASAFPPRL